MSIISALCFRSITLAALALGAASPLAQADPIIDQGWDYLLTDPTGTSFAGVAFQGVPLNVFDFGPPYGVQPVGDTDTIVHRLAPVTVPVTPGTAAPIPIELVSLNLRSVSQTDFGAGLGYYYISLQSARGGPASVGQMTITFDDPDSGTFGSFFDVYFDIRFGALNGPIVLSSNLLLSSTGSPWSRTPPAGAVLVDGVNNRLNGVDTSADFWPGRIVETHPTGAQHTASSTPAPGAAGLGAIVGVFAARRRR